MKQKLTPYIYILFLWMNLHGLSAQEMRFQLSIYPPDKATIASQLSVPDSIHSPEEVKAIIKRLKQELNSMGFLNPTFNTIQTSKQVSTTTLRLGQQINHAQLNIPNTLLDKTTRKLIPGTLLQNTLNLPYTAIPTLIEQLTRALDKKGEGFSTVQLTNIEIRNDTLKAVVFVDSSTPRHIDKIIVEGSSKLSKTFLSRYLKIKPGDVFQKSTLATMEDRLNNIPFITQMKPPELLFTKDSTHLYFFLKKKAANQFDGLLGFNSKSDGKGLQLNGYVDLLLQNLFNGGEQLSFSWKNNGQEQQQLKFNLHIPYLLGSKVSPTLQLDIYKQDSAFVNTTLMLNIGYELNPRHKFGLSLLNEGSIANIEDQNQQDFTHFYYGAFYQYQNPHAHPLFNEQLRLQLSLFNGQRNTPDQSPQTKLEFSGHLLWSLQSQHHIYVANQSKVFWSDTFLDNELYRLGGINSIRGFNEDQFFSNSFTIFNLEYRFNPNSDTYLYSITDFGSLRNKNLENNFQAYSFGLGYVFQTKMGRINLSYAIGGISQAPLNIDNSRLHLKFITNF